MHSPRRTINAIQQLNSLIICCAELMAYRDARRAATYIRVTCESVLGDFENRYLTADKSYESLIEALKADVLAMDAEFRPNE